MKIKALLTSAVTIALCLTVIAGSTFALFTKEEKITMQITAGALNVSSYADPLSVQVKSSGYDEWDNTTDTFENGGRVIVYKDMTGQNFNVSVENMTPGDAFKFNIVVENAGNFALDNSVKADTAFGEIVQLPQGTNDLYEALDIDVEVASGSSAIAQAKPADGQAATNRSIFTVTVTMAEDIVTLEDGTEVDVNDYQGAVAQIAFTVTSVQHVEDDNTNG